MDCIIQSLCSPLLIDCSRIELPRLSLDGNRFGRAEIRSVLHTFLQSFNYYNFISNIFSYFKSNQILKIMNFILFFCAQSYKVESAWKLFRQFGRRKKQWKVSILYLIWLEVRRLVWNEVVIVEWSQKCV